MTTQGATKLLAAFGAMMYAGIIAVDKIVANQPSSTTTSNMMTIIPDLFNMARVGGIALAAIALLYAIGAFQPIISSSNSQWHGKRWGGGR